MDRFMMPLATATGLGAALFFSAFLGVDTPYITELGWSSNQLAACACALVGLAAALLAKHMHSSAEAVLPIVTPLMTEPTPVAKFATTARPLNHSNAPTAARRTRVFADTVDVSKQLGDWWNKDGDDDLAVGDENFDVKQMPGVLPPVGFFDPAGLSTNKSEQRMRWFRESEIKHGRVAMLAAVGFVVQESFHPLFGGQIDSPSAFAFQETPLQNFWGLVVMALSAVESFHINKIKNPANGNGFGVVQDSHELGNFGFDPLGMKPKDPAALREKKNKELQNGRLAMLGIAGMVAQELVTNQKLGGASVSAEEIDDIRALAGEVSVMLNDTMFL